MNKVTPLEPVCSARVENASKRVKINARERRESRKNSLPITQLINRYIVKRHKRSKGGGSRVKDGGGSEECLKRPLSG